MRKGILTIAITGLIFASGLTAYAQEDDKAAKARKDIAEGQKDLREAKIDSAADYQKFRKDAEVKISENQKEIAKLKAKKASDSKEVNEKYEKKVADLQKKNDGLKKRIEASDKTETSKWTSFKTEFNHDMNELGHAIKDIGIDNK